MEETLEEALKNELEFVHNSCRNFDFDLGFKTGGLIGAKWQQEQDNNKYSEEDMTEYAIYIVFNNLITPKQWLEQFKNKQNCLQIK